MLECALPWIRRAYAPITAARRSTPADVDADPIRQFSAWYDAAAAADVPEVNAMTLATVDADGRPSARIVLLRGADARGLTFYTNYGSRKGRELDARPDAALLFFWPQLERRCASRGRVAAASRRPRTRTSRAPRASQVGAWASPQSEPIPDRAWLERAYDEQQPRFGADGGVPRPPHWGGYTLRPQRVRVLAGARVAPARPHRLPPRRRRLDDRTARAVTDARARRRASPSSSRWHREPHGDRRRARRRVARRARARRVAGDGRRADGAVRAAAGAVRDRDRRYSDRVGAMRR
jgi:pyridoxamine 5'-phosphate oxidase